MFGLLKRTKIRLWEIELLKNVLSELPEEFNKYIEQINLGLFKGVSIGNAAIPGYVGFTNDPDIYNEIHDEKGRDFEVYNVKIYDTISGAYLQYSIFFSFGTIDGYAILGSKKFKIDIQKYNVADIKLRFRDSIDFNRIKKILTPKELDLINPSDVYVIALENKEYFHLTDIEDGNFYAVDRDKTLYRITHDPYQVEKIDASLSDLLGVN